MTEALNDIDTRDNFIYFLGTSGARFSMIFQLRSSGGMWLRANGLNILIDPGPGSLARINDAFPYLDPLKIDAVIVTHRHLDHCGDLNVIIEALTYGGRIKKGILVVPEDAVYSDDPVLMNRYRSRVEKVFFWENFGNIYLGPGIRLQSIQLEHHGVQCFGFKVYGQDLPVVGFISDTSYKPELLREFSDCNHLVANVTLLNRIDRIDHLSVPVVGELLKIIHPKTFIMTHIGTTILKKGPDEVAESIESCCSRVLSARDDMIFDIINGEIARKGREDDLEKIRLAKDRLFHGSKKGKT